jgi:hypothetical protein
VARNLHAKFGADQTVPEFSTIFLKQQTQSNTPAVMSSSMMSHQKYPQNDSRVAKNSRVKFDAD